MFNFSSPPHNQPVVTVTKDFAMDALKIEVTPPKFAMAISEHMLAKMPADVVAMQVADEIGKSVSNAVLKAWTGKTLHELKQEQFEKAKNHNGAALTWDAIYHQPVPQPTVWWGDAASTDIQKQISMTYGKWMQSGGLWMSQDDLPPFPSGKPTASVGNSVTALFDKLIPGFGLMKQDCPACTEYNGSSPSLLRHTIIHLNDVHKWTREAIADWLETLDHDLSIKTPEEVNNGN